MKIIPYDERYKFYFVERDLINIEEPHPVDSYYFKLNDLSINIQINIKWIYWAYYFFKEVSRNLEIIKEEYKMEDIIDSAIQKIKIEDEKEHVLLVEDKEIFNDSCIKNLLEELCSYGVTNPNDKINVKLKLNLREFIILKDILKPGLWKE